MLLLDWQTFIVLFSDASHIHTTCLRSFITNKYWFTPYFKVLPNFVFSMLLQHSDLNATSCHLVYADMCNTLKVLKTKSATMSEHDRYIYKWQD